MFAIVGSGFGLYGYLPALVEGLGETVVLPQAYRARFDARPELQPYAGAIRWAADAEAALAVATGVAIATPPERQAVTVRECLRQPQIEVVLLEKPVAVTPAQAQAVLEGLRRARKRVRVGYTLMHTRWATGLAWPEASSGARATVDWAFMAHHFARDLKNWKRSHSHGGGVLRFFGVHLLALLARQGYRDVERSVLSGNTPDEPERWSATFSGPGLAECRVDVDSRAAANRFAISAHEAGGGERSLVRLGDPFELEAAAPHGGDVRIGVLERLLATLRDDDRACERLYDETNALWAKVEAT